MVTKRKKKGAQGPVSKGAYDAKSPRNSKMTSMVLGTKTNKSPNIRSRVPKPKASKKKK